MTYDSSEEDIANGVIVVVTKNKNNDIIILREGQKKSFWVELDEHGFFEWYLDDSKTHRTDQSYLNSMADENDEEEMAPAMITAEYLAENVDHLQLAQARIIIAGCIRDYY